MRKKRAPSQKPILHRLRADGANGAHHGDCDAKVPCVVSNWQVKVAGASSVALVGSVHAMSAGSGRAGDRLPCVGGSSSGALAAARPFRGRGSGVGPLASSGPRTMEASRMYMVGSGLGLAGFHG